MQTKTTHIDMFMAKKARIATAEEEESTSSRIQRRGESTKRRINQSFCEGVLA